MKVMDPLVTADQSARTSRPWDDYLDRVSQPVFARAAQALAMHLRALNRITPYCESPLEELFYRAWAVEWFTWTGDITGSLLFLQPQYDVEVGGRLFRPDFVVICRSQVIQQQLTAAGFDAVLPIAVELDGHDYHERTLEQVRSRDERDRLLQQADWKVFHFSASALQEDACRCAREVQQYMEHWGLQRNVCVCEVP